MVTESLILADGVASWIGNALAVLVGGLITWLASRHYYVEAGKDLRREADELRHLTVLRGLEEGKVVEFTNDTAGKPIGLKIELSGHV
jgi:hypothetical protein